MIPQPAELAKQLRWSLPRLPWVQVYPVLETALMEAQEALEKRLQDMDDMLSEAQRLLGDRP